MAVGVNIISDFDSKGISKAIQQFKLLETTSEKSAFVLKKAFLPALAVLGGLAFAGFKAAQAAAADELEQAKLAQTLEKVVGATSATVASTEKMIESMSRASGTADTELRSALSSLVIGSRSLTKATEGLALAQDIATASGTPLGAVADALAKAYAGNYKALQKLSPALRDLIKEGASTEEVFKSLNATFGGATANAADTAAGKMLILKNNFAELQESLGAALLPALEKITTALSVVVTFMADHKTTVIVFASAIGILAIAIVAFNVALAISTIVLQVFGKTAAQAAIAAAPISITIMLVVLALVALGIGILLVVKHFDTLKKVFYIVVNAVIGFLEDMVNNFIGVLNTIINGINLLIKGANLFGASIKPIGQIGEVSFGRVGVAAQQTKQQIENLERQALTAASAISAIGSTALTTGEKMAITNKVNRNQILENMARVKGAETMQTFFNKSVSAGGAAVETAAQKLEKYTDAIKGVTSAQKSLRDANKQLNESNKSLLEKTQALTEAQKLFNLITNGYGKDSKQAKTADQERSKSQRGLERANYGLEQAVFAVKDAEKALADLRKDPEATPQKIREAEISLASAKLSVADATDTQRESTQALTDAQLRLDEAINGAQIGSETYKDALVELQDAQKAEADATDAVTAALERQTEAVEALAEAEKKRREAGKDVPAAARKAADAAAEAVAVVVEAVKTVAAVVPAVAAGGLTQDILDQLNGRRGFVPSLTNGFGGGGGGIGGGLGEMFAFAKGGIVTSPMIGMVGESGAEAIIPLDRLGSLGSTYNISVTAGMGADGKDIGTQIVNALKRYERTNGSIPISVA